MGGYFTEWTGPADALSAYIAGIEDRIPTLEEWMVFAAQHLVTIQGDRATVRIHHFPARNAL